MEIHDCYVGDLVKVNKNGLMGVITTIGMPANNVPVGMVLINFGIHINVLYDYNDIERIENVIDKIRTVEKEKEELKQEILLLKKQFLAHEISD